MFEIASRLSALGEEAPSPNDLYHSVTEANARVMRVIMSLATANADTALAMTALEGSPFRFQGARLLS